MSLRCLTSINDAHTKLGKSSLGSNASAAAGSISGIESADCEGTRDDPGTAPDQRA